jgi:flagellar biosynthetic protein FlhB
VALGFDFETMEAPKVLAKGRNLMAEEIKQEARWAGVPVIENPPLARSLYRVVEPGQSIPIELYAAVASILAYLYRQRVMDSARQRRQGATGARTESEQQSTRPTSAARIPGLVRSRAKPRRSGAEKASGYASGSAGNPPSASGKDPSAMTTDGGKQ